MQTKQELEDWYGEKDPWKYEITRDDARRKNAILASLGPRHYERALDIGGGEGWITKELPANDKYCLEISDNALSRLPDTVIGIHEPKGKYDLVLATGVLYQQYDWRQMIDWIKTHASRTIIVAGIKDWLVPEIEELGKPVDTMEFPYRQYIQQIMRYEITP